MIAELVCAGVSVIRAATFPGAAVRRVDAAEYRIADHGEAIPRRAFVRRTYAATVRPAGIVRACVAVIAIGIAAA